MARTVREVMTHDLRTITAAGTILEAAREMREGDVGDVLILDGDNVAGILTDRDIAVRGVADERDPGSRALEIATTGVAGIDADERANGAAELMRSHDIRRLV